MIILDGKTEIEYEGTTKVAIGKFDGIHLGHQKLFREMLNDGIQGKSLVFTFSEKSPFGIGKDRIYSDEKRREIFEALGIDYVVEYLLDQTSASVEPETFVKETLVKRLHATDIYCGQDLSFGKRGLGNVDTILSLSKELNITLHVVEKEMYEGREISSTRIRNAIECGDIKHAEAMLGREF